MAVTKPDAFLKLLQKSKLLDAEKLAQARLLADTADDAKALAKALARQKLLTWWQAGQLLAGRSTFFLGKYQLIDLVGRGGMGRVFLAEHTKMGRRVALKIIPKQLGRDPALLEQFLTEARAIAALDHPNIVHAYSVDSEGDRYYLVMEYVEGQDLQRMVEAQGALPFPQAVRYIQQAADGLAHAHSRDLIHCDIKPANLLVNNQDVVKILDLGMARLIDRPNQALSEKDERLLGTVDYLAPEQAVASPDLDHRVDIYSLGCTLYFLLTGKPPFPEGTLHERILKHQTEQPRKIAELRPDAPTDLVKVCEKMMAKDPDDRFQSAHEVSQILARWSPAEPEAAALVAAESESAAGAARVQVKPDTASTRRMPRGTCGVLSGVQGALAGRRRTLWFAGVGGAAALVVLVGLIFIFSRSVDEADEKADSQVAAADVAPEDQESAEEESSEPSKPEVAEADDEWPEPSGDALENLRNFDPEAFFSDHAAKSAKPEAQEKSEAAASEKPEPQKAEADKPEPKEPETAKKKPQTKEPQKKQPEKKEPAKKPPEKPKPQDPFRELAEAVDLPEIGAGSGSDTPPARVFTIGKIHADPDVQWQLFLLGGRTTLRRNRSFVLEQDRAGAARAGWLVQLETATSGSDPTRDPVAKIWRDGHALQFQWAENASSSANYLRNCIVQVRVEGESKYVTLTMPKSVDPIPIDLEKGTVNAVLPVKWLPDGGSLRVEITKVEGREGHAVDPPQPAEPKKPFQLSFPRTDRHGNTADRVAFRLSFTRRPAAMLVKLQLLEPPSSFFRALKGNVVIERNRRENMRDEVNKKLHPKNRDQAPRGQQRSSLNMLLDVIEKELWYISFYDEVHDKAKIHFRVFTEVDGRQVVLAATEPPEN